MRVLIDNFALLRDGFLTTLSLAVRGRHAGALVLGTLLAAMRVSPIPPLRASGHLLGRDLPQHPADAWCSSSSPSGCRTSTCSYRASSPAPSLALAPLHLGVRLRGRALGHQLGLGRPGRGRPLDRPGLPPERCAIVVLPQAFRTVVPPLGSVLIAMFKNTSVVAGFAVTDLTATAASGSSNADADELAAWSSSAWSSATWSSRCPSGLRSSASTRATGGDRPMSSSSVLYDRPAPARAVGSRIGTVVGLLLVLAASSACVLWRLGINGPAGPGQRWAILFDTRTKRARRRLLGALVNTLKAAAVAMVLAIVLGTLLAVGRLSDPRWVPHPRAAIVEFFRGVPVVVLILFGFRVLPRRRRPARAPSAAWRHRPDALQHGHLRRGRPRRGRVPAPRAARGRVRRRACPRARRCASSCCRRRTA